MEAGRFPIIPGKSGLGRSIVVLEWKARESTASPTSGLKAHR